jgi:hypothetical protein
MARKIARGTVRAGSRTSPLGTNAASIPANAKMRKIDARESSETLGASFHRRFAGSMAKSPPTIRSSNGASFTTADATFTRAPSRTPTTFAAARRTRTVTSSAARPALLPTAGIRRAALSVKIVATAANATVPVNHRSTPMRYPVNGPNATSTYAYGPPVVATRLAASARQRTMRPIASAHTTYASGAAAPSRPVTSGLDGTRKIPPPIVILTIAAATDQVPSARMSWASPAPRLTALPAGSL